MAADRNGATEPAAAIESGPACGHCGSADVVPVLYGMPGPDEWAAEQRGEIALGGCIGDDNEQSWRCRTCDRTTTLRRRPPIAAVWAGSTPANEIAEWLYAQEGGPNR